MPNGRQLALRTGHQHDRSDPRADLLRHVFAENDRRHRGDALLNASQIVGRCGLCGDGSLSVALTAWVEDRGHRTSFLQRRRRSQRHRLQQIAHLRSYCGSIPFTTAPRARGPREISTCS